MIPDSSPYIHHMSLHAGSMMSLVRDVMCNLLKGSDNGSPTYTAGTPKPAKDRMLALNPWTSRPTGSPSLKIFVSSLWGRQSFRGLSAPSAVEPDLAALQEVVQPPRTPGNGWGHSWPRPPTLADIHVRS